MNRQARLHEGWTADILLAVELKKEEFSGLRREGEESGRVDVENRDAFRLWNRRTKLTSVNTKAFGRLGKVIRIGRRSEVTMLKVVRSLEEDPTRSPSSGSRKVR